MLSRELIEYELIINVTNIFIITATVHRLNTITRLTSTNNIIFFNMKTWKIPKNPNLYQKPIIQIQLHVHLKNKHFTVSYYVTYVFQSESTLYSCLNIKKLLTWNKHNIWSLSDTNWPVWLNGWVFVLELSGSGFESHYCHWSTSLLLLKSF